jgi:hypothetical protein
MQKSKQMTYDPRTPTDIAADEAWTKLKESKRSKQLKNTDQDKSIALGTRKPLLPKSLEEMARAMNLMNNDGSD